MTRTCLSSNRPSRFAAYSALCGCALTRSTKQILANSEHRLHRLPKTDARGRTFLMKVSHFRSQTKFSEILRDTVNLHENMMSFLRLSARFSLEHLLSSLSARARSIQQPWRQRIQTEHGLSPVPEQLFVYVEDSRIELRNLRE